jgi:hypothetical protein
MGEASTVAKRLKDVIPFASERHPMTARQIGVFWDVRWRQ